MRIGNLLIAAVVSREAPLFLVPHLKGTRNQDLVRPPDAGTRAQPPSLGKISKPQKEVSDTISYIFLFQVVIRRLHIDPVFFNGNLRDAVPSKTINLINTPTNFVE